MSEPTTDRANAASEPNGTLFSCPAPSWASEPTGWENGTAEHYRHARRLPGIFASLRQIDALDVTDGTVTFVRDEPAISLEFDCTTNDAHTTDYYPTAMFRGGWVPPLPDHITAERIALAHEAVVELLAAYDAVKASS